MSLRSLSVGLVALLVSAAASAAICGHWEADPKISYDSHAPALKFKHSAKEATCRGRMDYCPEGVNLRSADDSATNATEAPQLERQIRPRAEKPGAAAHNPIPRSNNE